MGTVDDADEEPENPVYPDCDNDWPNIAGHWSQSSECDFPPLDDEHHEILRGLLLVKGWVATDSKTPAVYVKTKRISVLRWLDDKFGIFSQGIRKVKTAEEARAGMDELPFDLPEANDPAPVYQWAMRSHIELEHYAEEWYETEESGHRVKRVPETIAQHRSPKMLLTWYLAGGRLDRPGRAPKRRAVFMTTSIPAKAERLKELMAPFNPRVYTTSDNAGGETQSLVLGDTESFFDFIGDIAPRRFREKWPDPDEAVLDSQT